MATNRPPWLEDEDRPGVVALGLNMRNEFLYGMLRELSIWASVTAPPDRWVFSADSQLNSDLRELWSLIAEMHFVHVLLGSLPSDNEDVRRLREIQVEYADETASHLDRTLERLQAFAGRYPQARVMYGLFEVDWDDWWHVTGAGEVLCRSQIEFDVIKQMVMAEVFFEMQYGTLCSVTADDIHPGMVVVTAGGEFDFELTIVVESFNAETQTARCNCPPDDEVKEIPLGNLRDHRAAAQEIRRRIEAATYAATEAALARPETEFDEQQREEVARIIDALQHSSEFALAPEDVEVGLRVCSVGDELETLEIAKIVGLDPVTQVATCVRSSNESVSVPLANLRNATAALAKFRRRVERLQVESLTRSMPGMAIIVTPDEGSPPEQTPN